MRYFYIKLQNLPSAKPPDPLPAAAWGLLPPSLKIRGYTTR